MPSNQYWRAPVRLIANVGRLFSTIITAWDSRSSLSCTTTCRWQCSEPWPPAWGQGAGGPNDATGQQGQTIGQGTRASSPLLRTSSHLAGGGGRGGSCVELDLGSPTRHPDLGHVEEGLCRQAHLPNAALLLHVFAHNGPYLALGEQLPPGGSLKVFIGSKLLQNSLNDANCLYTGPQWLIRTSPLGGQGQGMVGRLD